MVEVRRSLTLALREDKKKRAQSLRCDEANYRLRDALTAASKSGSSESNAFFLSTRDKFHELLLGDPERGITDLLRTLSDVISGR